jgi:hypothetical protein
MTAQERQKLKTQLTKRNDISSRIASIQLGQEIKEKSKRNGITLNKLAELANIPYSSVINYLYGTCLMPVDSYLTLWKHAQKRVEIF